MIAFLRRLFARRPDEVETRIDARIEDLMHAEAFLDSYRILLDDRTVQLARWRRRALLAEMRLRSIEAERRLAEYHAIVQTLAPR